MTDEVAKCETEFAARRRWVVRRLVPFSIISGVLLSLLANQRVPLAATAFLLYHYVFASLLGIVGGFRMIKARTSWLLFGLLGIAFCIATQSIREGATYALAPFLLVGMSCRIVGIWQRIVPVRIDRTELILHKERFQFTVWNLLAITLVVACFLSLVLWGSGAEKLIVMIVNWYLSQVLICLTLTWSILGFGRGLRRVAAVAVVTIMLGLEWAFLFDGDLGRRIMQSLIWFTVIEALMLGVALAFVSWSGWRLVPTAWVVTTSDQ